MSSISNTAIDKISAWEPEYTSNGIKSGVLLLKVFIRESHIDTNATTAHIREQLSSLDTYIGKVGNDIDSFNTYVKTLLEGLAARGETTNDLLSNLMKGYKAAKDKKFVEYITKMEEKYEDGEALEADTLMQRALNRYHIRKQKGEWEAPTPEEEMIQVLETKVQKLEKAAKKGGKSNTSKDGSGSKNKGGNGKSNKKQKKDDTWRFKDPPKAGKEKDPRTVDGKQYWWCPNHKAWCRHKPQECKGVGTNKSAQKKSNDNKQKQESGGDKKLHFAKAIATVVNDADESEDDE